MTNKLIYFLLIFCQISFNIICLNDFKTNNISRNLEILLFFCIAFFVPLSTFFVIYYVVKKYEIIQQDLEIQKEINKKLKEQRHDILNHLQTVSYMMNIGELEEANRCLEKLDVITHILSLTDKIDNKYIASVINHFSLRAEAKQVNFNLYGFHSFKEFPLSPVHTNKVLSNLLQNALDNVNKNGNIFIQAEIINGYFLIVINNDGKSIEFLEGDDINEWQTQIYNGKSTKGENHGMGLCIIKNILDQYDDCKMRVVNKKSPAFLLKLKINQEGDNNESNNC